ncbi:hypothetical protein RND81_13G143500, partial [Saponaria officinalis]
MSMLRRKGRKKKGKKSRKTKKTIRVKLPYIPQNVIEEIFHKLPYNAMIRSKLVCKTWNSIISNPNFMNDYYNRRRLEGNTHLIFLNYDRIGIKQNFHTISHSDLVDNRLSSIIRNPLEDNKEWDAYVPRLIGSYNGLVAISCYKWLILWNPLTKEHSS